jgi:glycosyltransferase involved in cell wall biosynthesis
MWMKHIERKAYQQSDAVVSLLPNALEHMAPLGLERSRFHYVPNGFWLDEWDSALSEVPSVHQKIFDWCTRNKKLKVVYTGSHGPPNALDQLLLLEKIARNGEVPYHFILIGDGIQKTEIAEVARSQNLTYLNFLPKVPREVVPAILAQADVCFLGWQKQAIYNLGISPNKLCDYFLAAKPILHALDARHDPVAESGAGITVAPYDPQQLDSALRKFCEMTEAQRQLIGAKGNRFAMKHLEWSVIGENYFRMCRRLISE